MYLYITIKRRIFIIFAAENKTKINNNCNITKNNTQKMSKLTLIVYSYVENNKIINKTIKNCFKNK